MSADRSSRHYPALDSLRAIAVTGVLLGHFSPTTAGRFDTGSAGVQLFFVLSGFLITGLLLEARERIGAGRTKIGWEWRAFLARRTLRIFPLYYGVLVFGLVFNVEHVRANAAWLLTYTYNFRIWLAGGWPDRLLAHFWSLAVEEQFYLIWPWLILCAPRRLLPWTMAALLPAALAFRVGSAHGWFGPPVGQVVLLPACWDLLAAGGLMAWARHAGWTSSARAGTVLKVAFAAGLAVFLWKFSFRPDDLQRSWVGRIDYSFDALFFAVLVHFCSETGGRTSVSAASTGAADTEVRPPVGKSLIAICLDWLLVWPALVYIGRISYGIYIFHNFMHYLGPGLSRHLFGIRYFPLEWEHVLWLSACSVAAAAFSYHFYERPWLAMKRRWSPAAAIES